MRGRGTGFRCRSQPSTWQIHQVDAVLVAGSVFKHVFQSYRGDDHDQIPFADCRCVTLS